MCGGRGVGAGGQAMGGRVVSSKQFWLIAFLEYSKVQLPKRT